MIPSTTTPAATRSSLAYNQGTLNHGRKNGVQFFEITDGPQCGLASHRSAPLAHGLIVTAEIADTYVIAHPRCQRAFIPRPDIRVGP